jgi:hypothetical protein
MRFAALAALSLLAVLAPAARADHPACQLHPIAEPPGDEAMRVQNLVVGPVAEAVRPALGERYAGLWFRLDQPRWYVAVAPRDADLASAREELHRLIDARLGPDDAQFVRERLGVVAMPYSADDLDAVQKALSEEFQPQWPGDLVSIGVGCQSGEMRVELDLHVEAPPETVARVEQAAARWGDRAVVYRVNYRAMANGGLLSQPLPSFARVRCSRGRLLVAPRGARRLVLRKGGRRIDVRRTTRVRWRGTVDVEAVLRDGRRVRERVSLPRCR